MTSIPCLDVGQLVIVTSGDYDGYRHHGLFRVLRPIPLTVVAEIVKGWDCSEPNGKVQGLLAEGYLERVPCADLYLGAHSAPVALLPCGE